MPIVKAVLFKTMKTFTDKKVHLTHKNKNDYVEQNKRQQIDTW